MYFMEQSTSAGPNIERTLKCMACTASIRHLRIAVLKGATSKTTCIFEHVEALVLKVRARLGRTEPERRLFPRPNG